MVMENVHRLCAIATKGLHNGFGAFRVLFDMMDGIDDYFPLHECAPQIKVKGVGCDLVSLY